jgi:hypothetical protein
VAASIASASKSTVALARYLNISLVVSGSPLRKRETASVAHAESRWTHALIVSLKSLVRAAIVG